MISRGMTGLQKLEVQTTGNPPHRGLVLTGDVTKEERVVKLPVGAMMQAQGDEVWEAVGDIINCTVKLQSGKFMENPFQYYYSNGSLMNKPYLQRWLALYVASEIKLGRKSVWWPYLEGLPRQFNLLEDFGEKALDELKGTHLHDVSTKGLAFHKAEYNLVSFWVDRCRPDFGEFTWEDWHWARTIVTSRSFGYDLKDGDPLLGTQRVRDISLIPFLDLANHKECNVSWYTLNGVFNLYSDETYHAGDEFFISYGDNLDNQHLMSYYGFVMDDNKNLVPSDCDKNDCQCVMTHLEAFNTTLTHDEKLLDTPMDFNVRNAIKLRVEQRKALLSQAVNEHCVDLANKH